MRKEFWFLGVLILVLLGLVIWQPQFGWFFGQFFLGTPSSVPGELKALRNENAALKAELAKLEDVKRELPDRKPEYFRALVYSSYPFNLRNKILVDAGRRDGILRGEGVVFGNSLIGKVDGVFEETALIKTVFDPSWQSTVRIKGGIDALLVGGTNPRLTIIQKDAEISVGDPVSNAAPDFPYGLPVGTIRTIQLSEDKLFKEADLSFSYEPVDIRTVFIIKNVSKSKP